MLCQFPNLNAGTRCTNCGYVLKRDYETRPVVPCGQWKQPARDEREKVCKHQSDDAVDVVLIACETCQGNVRKKFDVHDCAVFGKCLPSYSGQADAGHGCIGCEKRVVATALDDVDRI